jgi:hypothetical protein
MVMPGLVGGFGKRKFPLIFLNNLFNPSKTLSNKISNLEPNSANVPYLKPKGFGWSVHHANAHIKLLRKQIGPYLAGLIEGGGTISSQDPNSKTKKYNPKIIIVFKRNDLTLAYYLQHLTKCGTVLNKPERGYVLWQIQDIVSIFTIVSIINGFMRTPKIEALNRTIV